MIPGGGVVDELSVVVRQSIRMECEPSGDPKPKVTWYKNGKPLSAKKFRYMRLLRDGNVLQIVAARVKDTGKYTCKAENVAGKAEKQFRLAVHGKLLRCCYHPTLQIVLFIVLKNHNDRENEVKMTMHEII